MEPLTDLHHVALTVSNLDRSAEWYTRVLGMSETFREDSTTRRAAVFRFSSGGWSVGLVEHVGSSETAFNAAVTGLDHLAFTVATRDAMRTWADHLDSSGVEHSGPIEVGPGEILNFKDPDGVAMALFWDRPPDIAPDLAPGS